MIGGGDIDTNTALQLNAQRDSIRSQATKSIDDAPLPPQVKNTQLSRFDEQQKSYSEKVTHSFTSSLQQVFIVTTVLMNGAFTAAWFIREQKLE